ncbi:MAG: hypothetical protein K1X67_00290 [Fimbriimonadaceae bacterium]|nr:hypothetical protein [Fimbriimonadaceae bacterium]
MGKIRTIKPEFWLNEGLSSISETACLLAAALLNYVDDEGYFNANPGLVRAACFPLRELRVSIDQALTELEAIGFIELRNMPDGKRYGWVIKFRQNQVIGRLTRSKIKPLWDAGSESRLVDNEDPMNSHCGPTVDSMKVQGGLNEGSLPERNGKEKERKGKERTKNDNHSLIGSGNEELPGASSKKKSFKERPEPEVRRIRPEHDAGTLEERRRAARAELEAEAAGDIVLAKQPLRKRPEPIVKGIPDDDDGPAFEAKRRALIAEMKADLARELGSG